MDGQKVLPKMDQTTQEKYEEEDHKNEFEKLKKEQDAYDKKHPLRAGDGGEP